MAALQSAAHSLSSLAFGVMLLTMTAWAVGGIAGMVVQSYRGEISWGRIGFVTALLFISWAIYKATA